MLFYLAVGTAALALLLTLPVGRSMIAILVKACLCVVVAGIGLLSILLTGWAAYLYWPASIYTLVVLGGLLTIAYIVTRLFARPRRVRGAEALPPAPGPAKRIEPFL
jgi:hypothetical protein